MISKTRRNILVSVSSVSNSPEEVDVVSGQCGVACYSSVSGWSFNAVVPNLCLPIGPVGSVDSEGGGFVIAHWLMERNHKPD